MTPNEEKLRGALLLVLDQVDYTTGMCRLNDMVGAVLSSEVIAKAREAINDSRRS